MKIKLLLFVLLFLMTYLESARAMHRSCDLSDYVSRLDPGELFRQALVHRFRNGETMCEHARAAFGEEQGVYRIEKKVTHSRYKYSILKLREHQDPLSMGELERKDEVNIFLNAVMPMHRATQERCEVIMCNAGVCIMKLPQREH